MTGQIRDGLEPCPTLREAATMLEEWGAEGMRSITGFGISLLQSAIATAIRKDRSMSGSIGQMLLGGAVSLTSFDGHCVRIDFSTRDDAEAMFEALLAASAIEARRAETVKQGSVEDESAVPNGETPK